MRRFISFIPLLGCLLIQMLCMQQLSAQTSGLLKAEGAEEQTIHFLLDGQLFFRNNEYYNDFQEGYTLPGFHITPQLEWNMQSRVSLYGGFYLIRYNGQQEKETLQAVLRITFRPNSRWTLSAGTLKGGERRGLPDPLYLSEKRFTDPIEEGLEIAYTGENFQAQAWIDWMTYIEPGDTIQEELISGLSGNLCWISNEKWSLESPFALLISHRGGQVSSYDDPLLTRYNALFGFRAVWKEPHWSPFFGIRAYTFADNSSRNLLPFNLGRALEWETGFEKGHFRLTAGHWNGLNFYSPAGNPLFHNVSQYDLQSYDKVRSIWTARGQYSLPLVKSIRMQLEGGLFYERANGRADHYLSLVFSFNERLLLKSGR